MAQRSALPPHSKKFLIIKVILTQGNWTCSRDAEDDGDAQLALAQGRGFHPELSMCLRGFALGSPPPQTV